MLRRVETNFITCGLDKGSEERDEEYWKEWSLGKDVFFQSYSSKSS